MTATQEFGIEYATLKGRQVCAANFRSIPEADAYIDARIDRHLRPLVVTRFSVPAQKAIDVVPVTEWQGVMR